MLAFAGLLGGYTRTRVLTAPATGAAFPPATLLDCRGGHPLAVQVNLAPALGQQGTREVAALRRWRLALQAAHQLPLTRPLPRSAWRRPERSAVTLQAPWHLGRGHRQRLCVVLVNGVRLQRVVRGDQVNVHAMLSKTCRRRSAMKRRADVALMLACCSQVIRCI